MMWYPLLFALAFSTARATILQNGQVRPDNYTSTAIAAITASDQNWRTYPPSAQELSYKGRWDEQHISWWTAPGLKFGFQAESVALSFGAHTSEGVLLAYRLDGQDWTLTNVTANTTQLLIEPSTPGYNLTSASAGPMACNSAAYILVVAIMLLLSRYQIIRALWSLLATRSLLDSTRLSRASVVTRGL
jgi:hypothetical protein